MKNKYNNEIYKLYEEEVNKNKKLISKNNYLKLEIALLTEDNKRKDNNINNSVEKAIKQYKEKIINLKEELSKAHNEIDRLKKYITNLEDKNYKIDKLTNQVNKDSSNSNIPTSKELRKKIKRTNTYNHREKSVKTNGGQPNHLGKTLTKNKVEQMIKDKNMKIIEIKHHIYGNKNKENTIKYKIGVNVEPYVEKHIFIYNEKYPNNMPKEFYSDVTYSNDIKTIITMLGNYCSLSYQKIQELISFLSNDVINISEGSIDNFYNVCSINSEPTLNNITNNILNGKYQHTDETVTSESGKDTYYRGYANSKNVIYKYHHHKGDKPIQEDNILPNYYGTIISDHDTGIFKYGTNNQDCVIHIGRYCKEGYQNVYETNWQMDFYYFLLRIEKNRKILEKFGKKEFTKKEIECIENEYDKILERALEENKKIESTYWKEKEIALYNRLVKYKSSVLFYIYDFSISYDNNFMERNLRMIKNKTKMSGGFRSNNGGERFGNIMSVIKTAIIRKMNPYECIKQIFEGKELFA